MFYQLKSFVVFFKVFSKNIILFLDFYKRSLGLLTSVTAPIQGGEGRRDSTDKKSWVHWSPVGAAGVPYD